ncbi:MAG TPA: ComF family protein [Gammaproteobacteria bacterium]|nr:ComF family protein [Gammaproteobacteria bacterium]
MEWLSTRARQRVDIWLHNARTLWWPSPCVLCRASAPPNRDLCPGCQADLPTAAPGCPVCGVPLVRAGPGVPVPCGRCLRRPPAFDALHAAFQYADPVAWLIQQMKFRGRLPLARLLGELLAERLAARGGAHPDCIVPVPMHRARLRTRGFNQALELARPVGQHLGVAVDAASCRRVRPTAAQSGLSLKARRANLRNAFAVAPGFRARHVVILDDVVTSGQTAHEVARVLRRAGAQRIEVWTLARALPHH